MSATPYISLRALEPDDIDRIYIWENAASRSAAGGERAPLSRHQIWQYVTEYDANPFRCGQLRLMIEADDTPCGLVDLYDIDPVNMRAMVGILVIPEFQKRGVATEALRRICDYSANTLQLHQLGAEIAADNSGSLSLFKKARFTNESLRKDWYRRGPLYIDSLTLQRLL